MLRRGSEAARIQRTVPSEGVGSGRIQEVREEREKGLGKFISNPREKTQTQNHKRKKNTSARS